MKHSSPKGKAQQFAAQWCFELCWEAKHCTPTFGSKRMALRSSWRRRKNGDNFHGKRKLFFLYLFPVWKMVFHGHPPHGKQKASQERYVPRNPLKPETLRRFPKNGGSKRVSEFYHQDSGNMSSVLIAKWDILEENNHIVILSYGHIS